MKRLGRAIEIAAWILFFAFAAAVLALRYWLLPDIERYREHIVAAVSHGVGLPVRVGRIEAGWLGLRPQITLSDVRVYDAQGREALVLPAIDNVIAWRSVLHGEVRLHRLVIDGPRLTVRRDAAGELYVAGLKVSRGGGGGGGAGLGWLGRQGDILVRDAEIEWRDERRGAPPLALSGLQLRIASLGNSLSVGLSARPPAELGSALDLRALLSAGDAAPAALNARIFLQVGYTDLAAWRAWFDFPVEVRQGTGALRVWATLQNGELREGTADVALADLWASLGDHLEPLELATVRGRVHARALADGIELSGRGLEAALERGPAIPKTDFEIVWRPQAGGTLGATLIDLQGTALLIESLPLPPQLALMLNELAPSGRLADSRLDWTGPFDGPQSFTARARFSDLQLRARGAAPGFSGLSGRIDATQDRGRLELASKKVELDFPRLLALPVALESLAGGIEWSRDPARGLSFRVASLNFANLHLSGNLSGSYAQTDQGPGVVDLSAAFTRADGAAIARYLPHAAVMGEATRNWVANSVLAGQSSDVRVRLRGDLRNFPFADPASGQFQVVARVEKAVLDYAPGWPRIEDIAGELVFEGERMEITGRSGKVLGTELSNVQVRIPNLRTERHVLIEGQADGPTAQFLQFLATSPLRRKTGDLTAAMKASGQGKLHLKLDLPLADLDATRVAGEYDFRSNQVSVFSWLPPIEQAGGRVAFNEAGFTLQNVRGRLYDGAIALSGGARPGRGVEIVARGDAAVEPTRALLDHPLMRYLSGAFNYVVTVNADDKGARASFESPLRGVESALPAPLAKNASDSLPLRVDFTPSANGARDRFDITLGTLARAEVTRRRQGDSMQVLRTAIWVSPERDGPIRLSERPGTIFYGALAEFDADRWLPLLSDPGGGGGGEGTARAVSLDMKFGTLYAYGRRFTSVALRASADGAGWSANVTAEELAGDVSYRAADGGKVVARLERLSIPADAPGPKPAAGSARPGEIPAIDLVADEFTFRAKGLGRVELLARPE